MRATLSAVLLVVAACGGDGGSGPTGAYSCLGQPLPTTAPDPITVSGQVRGNALAPTAVAGAEVAAFRTGNATALATDTTDTPGNYSLSVATGGTPVNGYVRVSKTDYVTTYGYPATPLSASAVQSVLLPNSTELTFLGGAVDVTQQAGNGFIGVVVRDCTGTAVAGAVVSTTPAGTVKYNSDGTPSSSATSTSADGVAYVFNVTAGDVLVGATGGGHTLRAHTVNARADVVTLTEVVP